MNGLVRTGVLWLWGSLALPLVGQAQSPAGGLPGERRLIPPAPTTAGLGTYGGLPVDLNAGVVSVGVPLGEVRCRTLSLPVALTYRTTGIRVEEIASWVGIGWDLQPGGLITRTVHGLVDESPKGYYATFRRWQRADSMYRVNPTPSTQAAKLQADLDAVHGEIDTEPDTYTLSLPGYSATFLFDVHHGLHLSPFQNWRVSGAPDGTWEAVAPDGVRYEFMAMETTKLADNGLGVDDHFYSAWHLSAIVSANGKDAIEFDYETNQNGFAQAVPTNRISRAKLFALPYNPQNNAASYCPYDAPFNDGNVVTAMNYSTLSLRRIRAATTTVDFISDAARPDLDPKADPPGRRLTAVVFSDLRTPAVVRRFDFAYRPTVDLYNRLRLDAVQQPGQPAHAFQYNEEQTMPLRTSTAQDHWGFYNGQPNGTLIPAAPASVANGRLSDPAACANRATNPATLPVGVLTAVQYPTGGHTYFAYEANSVSTSATSPDDSVTTYTAAASGLRGNTTPSQLDAISQAVYDQLFVPNTWPGEPSVGTRMFTLPKGASNVFITSASSGNNYQKFFELWKLDDAHPAAADYQRGTRVYPLPPATVLNSLAAGTYLLFAATTELSDGATLELKMHVETGARVSNRVVGGLRIKRLVDYAGQGDSVVSIYDYTRYDSTAQRRVSSGRLHFDPQYIRFTACGAAVIAASDARTMSFAHAGYHVGYDEVSVTRRGAAHGKITYRYLNDADSGARNLVLEETVTDGAGGVVKQLRNAYYQEASDVVPLVTVSFGANIAKGCAQAGCPPGEYWTIEGETEVADVASYRCIQQPLLRTSCETTFAPPAGGNTALPLGQHAHRTYAYSRLPTGQLFSPPTWVRHSLSEGGELAVHTTYAREYAPAAAGAPAAGLADLLAHRVQTAVVETQTWRRNGADSVLVGGDLTHYAGLLPRRAWRLEAAAPVSPSAFAPSHVQNHEFVQDRRYTESVSYDRYDLRGNVEQEHYRAQVVSYLWNDDGTALLAKVSQARYGQIGYTSFEPAAAGRWSYDAAQAVAGGLTGRWSYGWGAEAVALDSVPPGTYTLTMWATSPPAVLLNGAGLVAPAPSAAEPSRGSGNYRCYRYQLPLSAALNTVSLSGPAGSRVDEVRLFPTGALMQSYTSELLNGVTSQTDPSGRFLTYEYDALGRLLRTRDEQGRVLSQQQYHYAGQ